MEEDPKKVEVQVSAPGEWMLQKVFGPVLGLVGEDLQRVYAAGRDAILANAYKKVEDPGDGKQANLPVTRDVLWNGSFADSEICAEYFGGIMASGLLGVLGMSDQEWERAGERGELPSGEPEVASPVEQRSTATA